MIDTSSQVHFRLNQLTSRVCVAARLALESADRRARALDKCFWEPDMCGACSFASSSLVMLLQRRSISSVLVMGTYNRSSHCWVETFDDSGMKLFVDITATQFKNSKIYVTTPGEDRKYLEELRGRTLSSRPSAGYLAMSIKTRSLRSAGALRSSFSLLLFRGSSDASVHCSQRKRDEAGRSSRDEAPHGVRRSALRRIWDGRTLVFLVSFLRRRGDRRFVPHDARGGHELVRSSLHKARLQSTDLRELQQQVSSSSRLPYRRV